MTINVVYLLYNSSIPANAKSAIGERLLARADEADRRISSPSRRPDRARYVLKANLLASPEALVTALMPAAAARWALESRAQRGLVGAPDRMKLGTLM